MLLPSAVLLSSPCSCCLRSPASSAVLVISWLRFRRLRDPMDRAIAWAAILLIAVQVAYFAYYAAGITATLWDNGAGFYFLRE